MFFGMYPSKYIGGTPFGMPNAPFVGGGGHPSAILRGNSNYFTGAQVVPYYQPYQPAVQTLAQPVNNVQNTAQNGQVNQGQNDTFVPQNRNEQINNLQNALNNAKNEQGIIGKFWDGAKGLTGLGLSSKKCQSYIDAVNGGQMSYEEAYNNVLKYQSKQKGAVNIISGILSGTLAAAAVGFMPSGASKAKTILAAAGVGAAAKSGIKTADRATNNVQNDALNPKLIVKDGMSGALDGAVSAATIGIGKDAVLSAKTKTEAIKQGAVAGAKGGAISGAVMGAGDYTIDCAFGDQKFEADTLITNTAYGAAAGAVSGAVTGALVSGKRFNGDDTVSSSVSSGDEPPKTPLNDGNNQEGIKTPEDTTGVKTPEGDVSAVKNPQTSGDAETPPIGQTTESKTSEGSPVTGETGTKEVNPSKQPQQKEPDVNPQNEPEVETVFPDEIIDPPRTSGTNMSKGPIEPEIIDVEYIEVPEGTTGETAQGVIPLLGEKKPDVKPEIKIEQEPVHQGGIKDNASRVITGAKTPKQTDSYFDTALKENAARVITEKKSGIFAKIKGIFGSDK